MFLTNKTQLPVQRSAPNTYAVHVKLTHGDADLEQTFTIHGFRESQPEDMKLLSELVEVLKAVASASRTGYPSSHKGSFSDLIPEFDPWFANENITPSYEDATYKPASEEERERLVALAARVEQHYLRTAEFNWPEDVIYGNYESVVEADLTDARVHYFDSTGTEFDCNVQF